jgi:hypothetical protein
MEKTKTTEKQEKCKNLRDMHCLVAGECTKNDFVACDFDHKYAYITIPHI